MALPPFNPFTIGLEIFHPAFILITIALFPPAPTTGGLPVTPSPQAIIEHAKTTMANALVTVPPFIEAWAKSPEIVEYLKSLEFIAYAGLQLIPKIGNQLASAGVRLKSIYAGTEFGIPVSTLPNSDGMDWEYVKFIKDVNVRWIPHGDDIFELHLLACQTHRPAILNLPDVEGLATSDIFIPHAVKEGLWKTVGRLSDIIVHSSGEKTIARPVEDLIMGNPLVKAVVVFGEGYKQPGALIEVIPEAQVDVGDQVAVLHLCDRVWPAIEEANKAAPTFSRIAKETLLFTAKGKPLPRTSNLTVSRKAAFELYALEISEVYENLRRTSSSEK